MSPKLSRYFTQNEFEFSQTAQNRGISNRMNFEQIDNAKHLCENVLDPVREKFGPLRISSGFRNVKLNKLIGGSRNSNHLWGKAADFSYASISDVDVALWIIGNLKFDKLILEYFNSNDFGEGWIHVSFDKGSSECEVISAVRGHRSRYVPGLQFMDNGELYSVVKK